MKELVILRGLPGSGKTAEAKRWVSQFPLQRVRISRSDLRDMLHDGVHLRGYGKRQKGTEYYVIQLRDALIRGALSQGLSVIVDDLNLREDQLQHYKRMANREYCTLKVIDLRSVPVDECIRRNKRKNGGVGEETIWGLYNLMIVEQRKAESP